MAFAFSVRGTRLARSAHGVAEAVPTVPDLRGSSIWSNIVPTDGTNAARVTNENFGTFSFYGSSRASNSIPVLMICGAKT
jgi:hypothetical protein